MASIFLCRIVFAFVIARKGAGAVAGRSRLAAARKNGTAGLHYPKNIAHAQDNAIPCRTVWDFVREFRGISATVKAKAICKAVRASRMSLTQFY